MYMVGHYTHLNK